MPSLIQTIVIVLLAHGGSVTGPELIQATGSTRAELTNALSTMVSNGLGVEGHSWDCQTFTL